MAIKRLYVTYAMDKETGGMFAAIHRKTGGTETHVVAIPPKTSACHNLTHARHHVAQWAIDRGICKPGKDSLHLFDRYLTIGDTCKLFVSGLKVDVNSLYNVSIDNRTVIDNELRKVLKNGDSRNQLGRQKSGDRV